MDDHSKYILNHPNQTGITDPRGVVKITSHDLEEIILFLANNHHFYPEKLPEDHPVLLKLNMFKTTISYLRGKEDYDLLYEIINRQFRPSVIKDETIGAFLFGCMQQDYGDIDRGCTISCLNSFNPDHQPLTCSYQLWIQKIKGNDNRDDENVRFKLFHDGINSNVSQSNFLGIGYVSPDKPSRAIIYINLDFDGFREEELRLFVTNGVTMAELMIKDGSRYKRVHPLTLLEKLPQINEDGKREPFQYKSGKDFIQNKFGRVTSSILLEDGVYVPFVTAYKGHSDRTFDKTSGQSDFHDTKEDQFKESNNLNPFKSDSIINLNQIGFIVLIIVLIIIFIAGYLIYSGGYNKRVTYNQNMAKN
uniref:Uncharacterized protein n=1 Tax=Pithovirus LCPAC201 TaxID=2506591 RepID=A0A481Z4C7_9VIRU|nr:MAG: hypothetical protein LCPAC201_00540 [Pithovirus LCPAC201]